MSGAKISYADMQDAATKLTNAQHQIQGDLSSLRTTIQGILAGGFVTDTASASFDQSNDEFTRSATSLLEGLGQMADYLNKAVSTYTEADRSLAHG